jgi:hypothetical protein
VPVPFFSLAETVDFINANSSSNMLDIQSKQAIWLYERTEGRPIIIGLVTDLLNARILTLEELVKATYFEATSFEATLVESINFLENPLNWILLFMAHVYHRFNMNLLEWLLQQTNLSELVRGFKDWQLLPTLWSLSFVRPSLTGQDFVLHDEMRRLIITYIWPKHDPETFHVRKALSQSIIQYYEKVITQTSSHQQQQIYILEKLYHQFFSSLDDGLYEFQQHFQRAIRLWNSPFAHLLLLEAQKFENNMSFIQQNELNIARTKIQVIEKDAEIARKIIYEGFLRSREMKSGSGSSGTDHAGENNHSERPHGLFPCQVFQKDKTAQLRSSDIRKIFYSYADEDLKLVEQLQMHLAILKQRNLITDWYRGKLAPGEEIANQKTHLNNAHIILLCISPYFVASDHSKRETMYALERHRINKATVIPILLRPTGNWKDASFGTLQALPRDSKAVTSWTNPDEAFEEIAREIKEVIDKLRKKTSDD